MIHKEKTKNLKKYKSLRKNLRNNSTNAERKLWRELRKSKIGGFKFRRQYSIDNYILDFYCPEKRVAIEKHFEEKMDYDLKRDKHLKKQGVKIVRFWNSEIFNNLEGILFRIREELGIEN